MKPSYQEEAETRGVRANGAVEFGVCMTGKRWYDLMALLESVAVEAHDYATVRRAVVLSEEVRNKLRGQGF